ncbi:MAG: hypothetical protein JSV80_03005 [Acidobacteriota bacterium]|nr:MAG: hypothetical protein JSV80_03005 [Acidobacteriota bacterium]
MARSSRERSDLRIALFGHPLGHSRSTELFAALATAGGPRIDYQPVDIAPQRFAAAIERLRAGEWDGANVTIPHKRRAAESADALDPIAATAGAANVLVRADDATLVGANTDGPGFVAGLNTLGDDNPLREDAPAASAVILGSGGAARGVAAALASRTGRVVLVSRNPDQAVSASRCRPVLGWNDRRLERTVREARLVVQATPLGMAPRVTEAPPLPPQWLGPHHVVVDLIYAPWETVFLAAARARGAVVLNGWPMLVEQAAFALELWAGAGTGPQLRDAVARLGVGND